MFCALDLLLFYVFFEFTLVPLFFLIGIWGGPERRRAANKFFIYTVAGSVLTFAGVLYIAYYAFAHSGRHEFTLDLRKLTAMAQSGALPAAPGSDTARNHARQDDSICVVHQAFRPSVRSRFIVERSAGA